MKDPNPLKMTGPSVKNAAQVFGKANETSGDHRLPPSDYNSPSSLNKKHTGEQVMKVLSDRDASEVAEKLNAVDFKGFGTKGSIATND